MEIQKRRSQLRSMVFASILFFFGCKIILSQTNESSGFEYIFSEFAGYLNITLSILLFAFTVYRTIKEIRPKRD